MNRPPRASTQGVWPAIGRLLVTKQHLLGILLALTLGQAALLVPLADTVGKLGSWTAYARAYYEFPDTIRDATLAVQHGSTRALLALLLLVLGDAVVSGWLRAAFLLGLSGEDTTLAPPLSIVVALSGYTLIGDVALVLAARAGGAGVFPLLVLGVLLVYSDYAIVVHRVGLAQGLRRGVAALRNLPGPTLAAFAGFQLLGYVAGAAFDQGFTGKEYIQPTFVVAFAIVETVLQFAADVVFLTLYRCFTAAGAARRP